MDTIKAKSVEDVKSAYAKFGVSKTRIEGLDAKFVSIPDEFQVVGLTAREADIQGEKRVIPEFKVKVGKVENSIPVGQMFAQYVGDPTKASQITKKGSQYKDSYLVSNNKRVNPFAEGLSEAEFIIACMDKKFKAEPAENFPVYSGFVFDKETKRNVLTFHESPEAAIAAIAPKSYRRVNMV